MSRPLSNASAPGDIAGKERTGTLAQAAVVAVASLALAWAGFQGSEWERERLTASDESAALREESARLGAEADLTEQQDTVVYVAWLAALEADSERTADRLFSMFRPGIQEYVRDAPTDGGDAPLASPFESPDYDARGEREEAARLDAERREQDDQARKASDNLARYAAMGVVFVVALVVTGAAGRFNDPYERGLRLLGAALLVIGLVFLTLTPLSLWAA